MNDESKQSDWTFDKWAETYDRAIKDDSQHFQRYDDILTAVVEAAKIRSDSRVLDIGVGTGNLALLCAELGAEVLGLDPFKGMLAKAEAKLARLPNVTLAWCENPFLSLPSEDASLDAIVSTFAFHHVFHEEKPAAVKELVRVLKPGGVIAIGDLLFESAKKEAEAFKEFEWLEDDEFYSRFDELHDMFANCGMELIGQQFTPVAWVVHATRPKDS